MPNDEITHIGELRPDPKNARKHTPRNVGTIVDALHEVGAARSIVIDEDNIILAGNATIEAAAQAGIERVRVVDADGDEIIAVRRSGLTGKQKTRLALYDNRAAEHAEWDTDVLGALGEEGALDGLFYEDELAALLGSVEPQVGAGGDEFDTTPDEGPTRVQPGDVWRIGPHRLMCGDSTNPQHVERLMGGERAEMVWADPPYGVSVVKDSMVGADFGVAKKGKYAPVIGDDTTQTARDAYSLSVTIAPKAVQIWWGANNYSDALPVSSCWLVWDKRGDTGIENTFADCELAWTNMTSPARMHRQLWNGMIREGEHSKRVHPTQKPVALAEWAFGKYGGRGIVFDPFLGSGTSLIAGHRTNRVVYGCELSPQYCDVILKRAEAEGIGPIELVENNGT